MDNISTFLFAADNVPFLASACVLAAILSLEIIGVVLGFSSLHHDVDFTADLDGNGIPDYLEGHSGFAGWFNPGSVPLMIFLVIFSTTFTVLGYLGQWVYEGLTTSLAPLVLSVPVVFALTLPLVRWGTIAVGHVMPKDESNAVTLASLTGSVGTIVVGPITNTQVGSIRVADQFGTDHHLYVFAEGDVNIDVGETAVLIGPHKVLEYAHMVRKI